MLFRSVSEGQVIGILDGFIRNGKYISTSNILYKLLSGIWLFMRPLRRPFQLAVAWIKRRIFKGGNGGIYEPEADKK